MYRLSVCSPGPFSGAWTVCFFNDTATTEIYTLSLHDALPIAAIIALTFANVLGARVGAAVSEVTTLVKVTARSEEHTSELQSRQYLVCRLLLEKKKQQQ